MIGRLALAAALVFAPAASAQDARPVDAIFTSLAFSYCPILLSGKLAMDNSSLMELGFPEKSTPLPIGSDTIPSLSLTRGGDRLSFAGKPNWLCRVTLEGDSSEIGLRRLRGAMADLTSMGTDFRSAPDLVKQPMAGTNIEGFKAKIGGRTLNLQLFQTAATKTVIAQLYVTEE